MVRESLSFAVGQEKLPPEQRATRTALLLEARWFCRQGCGKGPATGSVAKMNPTNCKLN